MGCCPPCNHVEIPDGACTRCAGTGVITFPADLYDPAEIACPWCQPSAYPDGFPGVKAQPDDVFDHWLIEPIPA